MIKTAHAASPATDLGGECAIAPVSTSAKPRYLRQFVHVLDGFDIPFGFFEYTKKYLSG